MTTGTLRGTFGHLLTTEKYPVLFVGHGSPMNGIEDTEYARVWQNLGEILPKPHAILVISAHWLTEKTSVDISAHPKTIYDFYGFPDELYKVTYAAPGAPVVASATRNELGQERVEVEEYGLDHGAWIVLRRMYPKADIPVFQLSIDLSRPAEYHYELGKSLQVLREHGVLIIGSGNIVHNLRVIDWSPEAKPFDWASEFDTLVEKLILDGKHRELCDYGSHGKSAHMSVPTPDHYYPFIYTLGAGGQDAQVTFPVTGIVMGSISMRCVLFQ